MAPRLRNELDLEVDTARSSRRSAFQKDIWKSGMEWYELQDIWYTLGNPCQDQLCTY